MVSFFVLFAFGIWFVIRLIWAVIEGITGGSKTVPPPKQSRQQPQPRWMYDPRTPQEVNMYIDFWGMDAYKGKPIRIGRSSSGGRHNRDFYGRSPDSGKSGHCGRSGSSDRCGHRH